MQFLLPAFTGLLLIIFGIAKGVAFGYWTGGAILIISFAIYQVQSASRGAKKSNGELWIAQFPNSQYAFCNGKIGIAVDSTASKLHLMAGGFNQTYPFSDVRSWRTNLQTGGTNVYHGGGAFAALDAGAASSSQRTANRANTGLFVTVRDVNHPEWHLTFSANETQEKLQQARWFEVLNQAINKT
jgi:Domain of unknown function (DUF4755)